MMPSSSLPPRTDTASLLIMALLPPLTTPLPTSHLSLKQDRLPTTMLLGDSPGRTKRPSSSSASLASSAAATTSSSSLLLLPDDLISACLSFLPPSSLVHLCACCDSTAAHSHGWVRVARDDEHYWRALILAIWPSWAPLLQRIEEEGRRRDGEQQQQQQQQQHVTPPFWRLYAARMRKVSQQPLPFTEQDAQEDEEEDEDEEEEGTSDASSSVPISFHSAHDGSIPAPPPPPPPSQLAASDVYIHFEVREEKGWWIPGKEGQTPSPVLFSALLSLADPGGVRCSVYHPVHYAPATLPGAVMEGGEGGGGGGGGGRWGKGGGGGALAELVSDNLEDPHFSLVIDTAAIHLPTGRVVRLHEQSRLRFVHSFSLEEAEEEEDGQEGGRETFFRVILDDECQGPCAHRYRFEVSFSPSIVLPPPPSLQQEGGKEGGGEGEEEEARPPRLRSAPLELRFFDQRTEEYLDEEVSSIVGGADKQFLGEEGLSSFARLVTFFLRFLHNRKGAWSRP